MWQESEGFSPLINHIQQPNKMLAPPSLALQSYSAKSLGIKRVVGKPEKAGEGGLRGDAGRGYVGALGGQAACLLLCTYFFSLSGLVS